ncbi:hypothetical protein B0A48_02656 [Cryoendolithus antarcticus]|uniref:Transcriptional regulatory protein RXT2 N-terminal domain-containing protein n=1 Tax=Cryoendolithus antarcticus TaxID=1507870 RepID=A0A1V8TKW8_9PEZI|nr:hypothetical protein B0A48_02656 [Cryoendolithus antarcticus]
MAAQQIQIAETIRAMKLALKRRPDDAEDSDDLATYTNRGNKLKRRAQFVREGRLDNTGRLAYRKTINHAGYTRQIIASKPPLLDDDGELHSPGSSDDEHERHLEPAEEDPFGQVRLQQLLRPITAAHELVEHPGLSAAYKSSALTQMTEDAADALRRERDCLLSAKRLLRRFRGEPDWVPCGTFEGEHDEMLLHEQTAQSMDISEDSAANASGPRSVLADSNGEIGTDVAMEDNGIPDTPELSNGVHAIDMARSDQTANGDHGVVDIKDVAGEPTPRADDPVKEVEDSTIVENGTVNSEAVEDGSLLAVSNPTLDILRRSTDRADSENGSHSGSGKTHGMTTRARARSPDLTPSPSPTPSDSASAIPAIHPWFIAPSSSIPDRDLGLPGNEAAETRKILLLYCQKQEQVIRSLETLYFGLQKAERLRSYVFRAAKASGHLLDDGKGNWRTEMSDGEDWYDPDEWNLAAWELKDGVLEKGKDEVEDPAEEEGRRGGRRRRVAGAKAG